MVAPVVVGVDDLDWSPHALELAGREAELRGAPLWIAHAYHRIPSAMVTAADGGAGPAGTAFESAAEPLAGALKQARADHPEVEVRGYALSGSPARGLAALAADASLLVLGHRGRSGFAGMLLGSVTLRTVARVRCPVAVARGARRLVDRVLVGIDVDDVASQPAQLAFAFNDAVLRGAELVVLHTWEEQGYFSSDPIVDYTGDHLSALDREHRGRLEAVLEPWRRQYPDVVVDVQAEGGSAARRLVETSAYADLLVVGGSRHHDGEAMWSGGLAYTLLHHAECPVVIVPN
jgi:nucleotide-binding universal stress UspA family protein